MVKFAFFRLVVNIKDLSEYYTQRDMLDTERRPVYINYAYILHRVETVRFYVIH